MFVITYIKNGDIVAQSFLDNKDYENDELKNTISTLHEDCRLNRMDVYLNGIGLDKYASLGTLVSYERILDNLVSAPKPNVIINGFR